MKRVIYGSLLGLTSLLDCEGCSNIIVTPGASDDFSSIISYNADSGTLFGSLYHYPTSDNEPGVMRDIYDWDSGHYLGQIEEAAHTFNVVGNINEHGLIIGETTFGGISSLQSQSGAIMDYGSLIWVTLQRAQTAREAITTLGNLMAKYGYASGGESFSIADQKEAWIMEIIGKGNYEKGSVWVARKIPDGYVSAHANLARITTFPLNSPDDCIYASDTISFAKSIGLYSGKDEDFSFSDIYDPVTFDGARFCDARVWSFFGDIMGEEWAAQYESYAQGYNLTNRMPLWVKPLEAVSLKGVMEYMRNHYEGTSLDMTGTTFRDVGAGFGNNPNRVRPLTWSSNGNTYFNERAIGTPQTGWNFVAQSRASVPSFMSGLLWFGVDDSSTTVHFPVYGSVKEVSPAFAGKGAQDGVITPILKFDFNSAFSVFNLVANWAYSRWNTIYPDVYSKIIEKESEYMSAVIEVDKQALLLLGSEGSEAAVDYLTAFSKETGDSLVQQWGQFFGDLFMKYRDGYVVTPSSSNQACGCSAGSKPYPQEWYDRIAEDTGDHLKYPVETIAVEQKAHLKPVSKVDLLSKL